MDNDFTPKEAVRVKRFFSQEELDEKRKIQTNYSIELDDLEDEIISRETDSIFSQELNRLANFLVVKQW